MADEIKTNGAEVQMAVDAALKEQKKKKRKKRLIIFGVIILVIIVIAAVSSGGSDDSPKKVDSSSPSSQSAEQNTEAEGPMQIKVGEAVEMKDLKISFTSCETDFKDYPDYSKPDKGMKYVRATFTFENIGDDDEILDSFDCYADDTSYEQEFFIDDSKSQTLESISSGKKFNAVVYYEVPADSKSVILQYETDYFSSDYVEFVIQ